MVSCFNNLMIFNFCKLVSYIIPTKRNIIRKKQILNRIFLNRTFQYESKKFFTFSKWMHNIYSKITNDKRYILRYLYFSLLKYPNNSNEMERDTRAAQIHWAAWCVEIIQDLTLWSAPRSIFHRKNDAEMAARSQGLRLFIATPAYPVAAVLSFRPG